MRASTFLMCALGLMLAGCATTYRARSTPSEPTKTVVQTRSKKAGPPPHAPAHGYRHKHKGTNLRYDAKTKVYVVVGRDHHYYHDGVYFRWARGEWHMAAGLNGDWGSVSIERVPGALRAQYRSR